MTLSAISHPLTHCRKLPRRIPVLLARSLTVTWERTHRPSIVKDILIHYLTGPREIPQKKLVQN